MAENELLSVEEYKEYFRHVMDLEVDHYELLSLKQRLNDQLEQLSIGYEPVKKPSILGTIIKTIFWIAVFAAAGGIICGIIALAIGFIFVLITSIFFRDIKPPEAAVFIQWGAAIGAVLAGVIVLCRKIWVYKNERAAYINTEMAKRLDLQRINELQPILAQCEQEERKKVEILQAYYDKGVVYKKYQGLVPIATIYEYLESGRCNTLTGHEGAYNLYESELLMHTIIGRLDDIIDELDDIRENQRMLYDSITDSNRRIENFLDSIDNKLGQQNVLMQENNEISEYYGRHIHSDTTALTWLYAYTHSKSK